MPSVGVEKEQTDFLQVNEIGKRIFKTQTLNLDLNSKQNYIWYCGLVNFPLKSLILIGYKNILTLEDEQIILKSKNKEVFNLSPHDELVITYATVLIHSNQYSSAVNILREIALGVCSSRLTHANAYRYLALIMIKNLDSSSYYKAKSYWEQALSKYSKVKSIFGTAITLLLEIIILNGIIKFEDDECNLLGGENTSYVAPYESRLNKAATEFSYRINQLISIDQNKNLMSIHDLFQEMIKERNITHSYNTKMETFQMHCVNTTEKETHLSFEIWKDDIAPYKFTIESIGRYLLPSKANISMLQPIQEMEAVPSIITEESECSESDMICETVNEWTYSPPPFYVRNGSMMPFASQWMRIPAELNSKSTQTKQVFIRYIFSLKYCMNLKLYSKINFCNQS